MKQIIISLFITIILLFPPFIFSKHLGKFPLKQKKALQKAVERGHAVSAKLLKSHLPSMDNPRNDMDRLSAGIYEFEYRGKKYKRRFFFEDPPYTLELYFLKNPRYAAPEGNMETSEFPWVVVFTGVFALLLYVTRGW